MGIMNWPDFCRRFSNLASVAFAQTLDFPFVFVFQLYAIRVRSQLTAAKFSGADAASIYIFSGMGHASGRIRSP